MIGVPDGELASIVLRLRNTSGERLVPDGRWAAVHNFFAAVRVFHGEIERFLVNCLGVDAPALGRVCERLLETNEFGKILIVERVGLTEVAAGVELVEPNLSGRCPFVEEQDYRLHSRSLKCAARAIQHSVKIATLEEQFAKADRSMICI
jgi:hypothetical protein